MEYIDKVKNLVLTIWELRYDKFDLVEAGLIFLYFMNFCQYYTEEITLGQTW